MTNSESRVGRDGVSVGRDNNGIIGNGGSITIYGGDHQEPQPYSRRRIRLLPITERAVAFAASIVTLAMFLTGWQTATQWWAIWPLKPIAIRHGTPQEVGAPFGHGGALMWWCYGFLASVLSLTVLISLWRIIHQRTQHYSRFASLPGLVGVNDQGRGRLALVRNSGVCLKCGGTLRFYAKVTKDHYETDSNGNKRRVVDERIPVVECERNPRQHWQELDITDTGDLNLVDSI